MIFCYFDPNRHFQVDTFPSRKRDRGSIYSDKFVQY